MPWRPSHVENVRNHSANPIDLAVGLGHEREDGGRRAEEGTVEVGLRDLHLVAGPLVLGEVADEADHGAHVVAGGPLGSRLGHQRVEEVGVAHDDLVRRAAGA